MARSLSDTVQHLRYLLRGIGPLETAHKILKKIISPLVEIDTAYIAMRYRDTDRPIQPVENPPGITTAAVTSETELAELQKRLGNDSLVNNIVKLLEQRNGQVIVLALRESADNPGQEIIGYFVLDKLELSYWNEKLRVPLPEGTISSNDAYVAPPHRGKGMHHVLLNAKNLYCFDHGYPRGASFIKTDNIPSIVSQMKPCQNSTPMLMGSVRRIAILGGLFERMTPNETIAVDIGLTHAQAKPMEVIDDSTR